MIIGKQGKLEHDLKAATLPQEQKNAPDPNASAFTNNMKWIGRELLLRCCLCLFPEVFLEHAIGPELAALVDLVAEHDAVAGALESDNQVDDGMIVAGAMVVRLEGKQLAIDKVLVNRAADNVLVEFVGLLAAKLILTKRNRIEDILLLGGHPAELFDLC